MRVTRAWVNVIRPKHAIRKGPHGSRRTLFAGVGLHELILRTGLLEFRGQPCQLWQNLVDESDFGREVVLVDVQGEEAADVACVESHRLVSTSRELQCCWNGRDAWTCVNAPNPPMIKTAGFAASDFPPAAVDAVGTVCPTSSVIVEGGYGRVDILPLTHSISGSWFLILRYNTRSNCSGSEDMYRIRYISNA